MGGLLDQAAAEPYGAGADESGGACEVDVTRGAAVRFDQGGDARCCVEARWVGLVGKWLG